MTTDRDGSIERLLRRALPSDRQASGGDCPDAETLAALADDTLTAAARREIEGHVADCRQCQELTAAMVRAEAGTGTDAQDVVAAVPWWKGRALRWLTPAAAAATALALWVLVPGQRMPLAEEPAPEAQVAAAPPAVPPEGPSSESLPVEPPRSEPAPADARADAQARERDAQVELGRAAVAGDLQASGPEPRNEARESAPVQQERALNQPAAPQTQARAAADAAGARAAAFDVVSPNPGIRWRVGPGLVVQYSADGGATWVVQQTGTSAQLTAGSSPAAEVCWLVGRGGIVLRTTDGGRQWQPMAFPEAIDLTAVTASTALNAVVTLADGRRLATTDGGRTWTPLRQ